nr:MAG TPA_asm: hypothetical protein [Caudoviricetes sp.]
MHSTLALKEKPCYTVFGFKFVWASRLRGLFYYLVFQGMLLNHALYIMIWLC